LDQPSHSSSREVRAPVHGRGGFAQLLISVKALLDMTHQQCLGFVMVTVGMVVGMVALKATRKRTSPIRSRILPLPILIKKNPVFWWQNLSLSEGLLTTPVNRVESEFSPVFQPRETPLFSTSDELLQCLHHAS